MALHWDVQDKDGGASDLEDRWHQTRAALVHNDYSQVMESARSLAPQATEADLAKLARRFLESNLMAIKAEIAALDGEPLIRPPTAVAVQPSVVAPKETPRFSEVAVIYGDERVSAGRWSPKTAFQNRAIYSLLADLLGDPQLGAVTKAQVRKVGQDIVNLPANMTKRFPGVTPSDVLKRLEGDTSTARLEPRSVNKYRQLLRSLFKWAVKNDLIIANPTSVLEDVKEGRARDGRKPFTDEDIRLYFRKLPQSPEGEPFLFWIPRILAYTGMRLGEAAQLQREDVRQEDGVWIFDVNDEVEGKRLKTGSSKRKIPIHPRLVELGLLPFVQSCPRGFLWPERVRATSGAVRGDIDRLSRLLGKQLRSAGVTDPKKTGAHSFRHTVAARLKNASVPDYQIADLVGHEDDSMTTGRYGERTGVIRLAEVVSMLKLPI